MEPGFRYPRVNTMGQSYNGSVPGSIPINVSVNNLVQETLGIPGGSMSHEHVTFTHKTHHNKMHVEKKIEQSVTPQQKWVTEYQVPTSAEYQNYSQLPIRKEVDDEGRINSVALPETPANLPTEGNHSELGEIPQEEIKTEEEDISYFMETSKDTFLKIMSKELTIKKASDILGRPYSFVYTRFQEFMDNVSDEEYEPKKRTTPKKKKKSGINKKGGKKKGRAKKLNWANNKSRSTGKTFECEECPYICHTEYLIKTHEKVHTGKKEAHTCTECGVVCAKLLQLMRHRIEVHEEALQCPHCESQFTIIASYKKHVRTHTGTGPWVCKECGKGYYSKFHLDNHSRKHTGERPFMCGYCEKTFMTLQHLKSHSMSLHQGIPKNKNYECEICPRKYQSQADLNDHMNVHAGAKPYACDMCEARFNFKTGLERHRVTHSDVHPYQCDLCPAGFYQKKNFEQHKIVHTGLKAFKCDLCDFSCTRKHTLEYHKYEHTGEKPFKCDAYGCTAAYTKPQSLNHHKLKKHGVPPCKVCHEKFPDITSLNRHMMIHTGEKPQTCETCLKVFYKKSSMKRHMYSHMDRPAGSKSKQARQSRKVPVEKKIEQSVTPQQKWVTEYQVPTSAENGHNLFVPSLPTNSNTEDTYSQHSQPSFHPFTAVSQYSNLVTQVNNSWPSAMDADELRRRLLSSFK